MATIFQRFTDWIAEARGSIWDWFSGLSREEWVVVLGAVCILGFLCMLGYGSRSKY